MATKRALLEHLTADELRGIIDHYELWVQDRRARAGLIDAVATSRKADLEPVLTSIARDRLKELCRKLGLDDGGRDKAAIVARLLGNDAVAVQPRLFDTTSAVASDALRDVESPTTAPRPRGAKPKGNGTNGGDLGFEAKLWQSAVQADARLVCTAVGDHSHQATFSSDHDHPSGFKLFVRHHGILLFYDSQA